MIRFVENLSEYFTSWENLSCNSPYASFFQSRQCHDFYSSLQCFESFSYGVMDGDELLAAVTGYVTVDKNPIVQFFSRRAIIQGGVLISGAASPEAVSFLLKETSRQLGGKAIYIEIRNYFDYSPYKHIFKQAGFEYERHYDIKNDTSSLCAIESSLSDNIKRCVKSSINNGVRMIYKPTARQIRDFYAILQNLYRSKIKRPLFPLDFFLMATGSGIAHWFMTEYKGEIVGGMFCVGSNNRLYEWFVCGLDGKYKGVHPSKLATYSALCYCAENGFSVFDMMGAGKPDEGYGVRDFKARFGGKLVEEGRFVHIAHPLLYKIGKWGVKLLKKI